MAFLRYFLLVTLLAFHANEVTSETCTDGGTECGTAGTGYRDLCEDLTGGTKSCACAANYVRTTSADCVDNTVACSGPTDTRCATAPFKGTCGTPIANECECAAGYENSGGNCKVKPAVPVLSVTPDTDLNELISGQTYTLACAVTETVDFGGLPYTYTFSKGGVDLNTAAQTLTTATQATNGATDYKCKAEYDGVSTESAATTIRIKPATPTVSVSDGTPAGKLSAGADYTLSCVSDGAPATTTYAWKKDTTTDAGTTKDITLTTVTAANDGAYTCVATAGTINSDVSNTLTIVVGEAGKYCAGNGDCTGTAYSDTCTNDRCVCAAGYEAKAKDCSLKKPSLIEEGGTPLDQLSEGGTYKLVCTSEAAGATFTFQKVGGAAVGGGLLPTVSATDNGKYTCTVSANGAKSDASEEVTVTVGAAGKYCSGNNECPGIGYTGTCKSATKRCECDSKYEATGKFCSPSGLSCTDDGGCDGTQDQFTGTCGGDDSCDCATNYEKSTSGCEKIPAKPTLKMAGDQPHDDLSAGATYTLTCKSATTGTSFEFYKENTLRDSGSLTKVSASDDDGTYTCTAVTSGGVRSPESDALKVEVKASGKYCANNAACDGSAYTGKCTGTRCDCAEGRTAEKDTCSSSAIKTATISIFSLLLAFMVSKLL